MTLRIGTRGSALALTQSSQVAEAFTALTGTPVELVEIATAGDRSSSAVSQLGVGVFVSALRDALSAKEIDAAIHSYKDLPTAPAEGLRVAAVPERADPRDVLVARDGLTLAGLPSGARVGTGAPRRVAQLRAARPDLELLPVRGNVDTRLRKVATGELDAVVLARAGLARLGRSDEATEVIDPGVVLPAPAQGALAVECRTDDTDVVEALELLDHVSVRVAITAERALMSTLEAGCSAPVAGLAESTGDGQLRLRGAVISLDGRRTIRLTRDGTVPDGPAGVAPAEQLGRDLAAALLAAGANTILGVSE